MKKIKIKLVTAILITLFLGTIFISTNHVQAVSSSNAHSVRITQTLPTVTPTATTTSSGASGKYYQIDPDAETKVKTLIHTIFSWIFGVIGALFVVVVIVGGLQYLTSSGNEDAASKGKKTLTNGIIGLVIAVSAYAIYLYIANILGITTSTLLSI